MDIALLIDCLSSSSSPSKIEKNCTNFIGFRSECATKKQLEFDTDFKVPKFIPIDHMSDGGRLKFLR